MHSLPLSDPPTYPLTLPCSLCFYCVSVRVCVCVQVRAMTMGLDKAIESFKPQASDNQATHQLLVNNGLTPGAIEDAVGVDLYSWMWRLPPREANLPSPSR